MKFEATSTARAGQRGKEVVAVETRRLAGVRRGSRRKRPMLLGQKEKERFMVRPSPGGKARREFLAINFDKY